MVAGSRAICAKIPNTLLNINCLTGQTLLRLCIAATPAVTCTHACARTLTPHHKG